MEEYTSDLSVIDVYDIASAIGKEFEKIIDVCGPELVTNLMPKVINALEQLESLATKNERENLVLEDLKGRIIKLENDKNMKAEDRLKFEKELEQIEEEWRKESSNLVSVIAKLQEENKRLNSIVTTQSLVDENKNQPEIDVSVVHQLQHQINQLRDKLKTQNAETISKCNEIENLENQIDHLETIVKDLRRKQDIHISQMHGLIEERGELLVQVQNQHREILLLHQRLGIVQKENEDLSKTQEESDVTKNKVLYDVDDPNRPRFTTDELKEILHERNELKAKLNDLQDELSFYRTDSGIDTSEIATEMYSMDEESPVQGPLPLDPEDAPWKRSESGIRKLFRKLFIEPPVLRKMSTFSSKSSKSSPTKSDS